MRNYNLVLIITAGNDVNRRIVFSRSNKKRGPKAVLDISWNIEKDPYGYPFPIDIFKRLKDKI